MRRSISLIFFAISLGLTATPAFAQRTIDAALGARIRLEIPGDSDWKVGRLKAIKPDTLGIQYCSLCDTTFYALNKLGAIQVSAGRTGSAGGLLLGALAGGLVGTGIGLTYAHAKMSNCHDDLCGLEMMVVPAFGVGGILVGAIIGARLGKEVWEPAEFH